MDEGFFGDGPPNLGPQMTAAKTVRYQQEAIEVLLRAGKSAQRRGQATDAEEIFALADKLHACRPRRRCGSLACPMCARAFQRAKTIEVKAAVEARTKSRRRAKLVFVTIVPTRHAYPHDELGDVSLSNIKRWIKDVLTRHGLARPMIGCLDINVNDAGLYQIHLHAAMWTQNPARLSKRILMAFPGDGSRNYQRPVQVNKTTSLGFIGYSQKVVRFDELLRHNRRTLPALLLLLDRTRLVDLHVLFGYRLSAQFNGVRMYEIEQ